VRLAAQGTACLWSSGGHRRAHARGAGSRQVSQANLDSIAGSLAARVNRHDHVVLAALKVEAGAILRPVLEARTGGAT
jgi:hypothetical protein